MTLFSLDAVTINYIGYVGSVLVAISLTMNNLFKLRVINLMGASIFSIYGFLNHTYPVFLLNSFISLIDIFYLSRMYLHKNYFTFNHTIPVDDLFISQFLSYYKGDIAKFFPEFSLEKMKDPKIILISRHLNPVGLFIYEIVEKGVMKIHLDYACPQYRDFKNFLSLLSEGSHLLEEQGVHTMISESRVPIHQKYLKKMGFKRDYHNPDQFIFHV